MMGFQSFMVTLTYCWSGKRRKTFRQQCKVFQLRLMAMDGLELWKRPYMKWCYCANLNGPNDRSTYYLFGYQVYLGYELKRLKKSGTMHFKSLQASSNRHGDKSTQNYGEISPALGVLTENVPNEQHVENPGERSRKERNNLRAIR